MGSDRTDEELMAAYVAGEREAFGHLFSRWAPRLGRLMRRDGLSEDDAGDLVQQTFLHLHRARRDFRPGAALRPWLYTIALNLRRQHYRRLGRRREVALDPVAHGEPPSRGTDPETSVTSQWVREVMQKLPAAQREVIELHWFEGLSFREVADVVGAGTSAVKVRAHRGYAKLRELMAQQGVTGVTPDAYGRAPGGRAS